MGVEELESGPIFRFANWPNKDVPRLPGVYSIWNDDGEFIYVGMAGRGVQVEDIDENGHPKTNTKGLFGRLGTHANGKRSGDQFNVYVCDRFVVPDLGADILTQLRAGANTLLDVLTKTYVHDHLQYRYVPLGSGKEATNMENAAKVGALSCGPPILNPAKVKKSKR